MDSINIAPTSSTNEVVAVNNHMSSSSIINSSNNDGKKSNGNESQVVQKHQNGLGVVDDVVVDGDVDSDKMDISKSVVAMTESKATSGAASATTAASTMIDTKQHQRKLIGIDDAVSSGSDNIHNAIESKEEINGQGGEVQNNNDGNTLVLENIENRHVKSIKSKIEQPNNDDDGDSDSDIEIIGITPSKQTKSQNHSQEDNHHQQHQQQQQQQQQHQQQQHQYQQQQYQQQQQQQYYHHQQQGTRNMKIIREMENKKQQFGIVTFIGDDNIIPPGYIQTWRHILPPQPRVSPSEQSSHIRAYKLSLYSQSEFVLTALHHHTNPWTYTPTLQGFRKTIKDISKHYGGGHKATYEPQTDDENSPAGGKWRIPLSAYRSFVVYLQSDPMVVVEKIPQIQLKIASIGKAVSEREYPSIEEIIELGVPRGLAHSLAPYQRGGVDFVLQKNGRALIADDMGLGKTIQSIASMCCYSDEWPLLVLSPSSARYHWEAEFLHWLGEDSELNSSDESEKEDVQNDSLSNVEVDSKKVVPNKSLPRGDTDTEVLPSLPMKRKNADSGENTNTIKKQKTKKFLMKKEEIHVLSSSKDFKISARTKVVVCSYGLISNLVSRNAIHLGQFQCVIVDESHMLKNKKSKRTKSLMPILQAAKRVVMLSGTPAMAKPIELYPQLVALDRRKEFWGNEAEFVAKYCGKEDAEANFAELNTLLKSTLMIRRMKQDVLRSLPDKSRENVTVNVRTLSLKNEIAENMNRLRQGKGLLGKMVVQNKIKMTFDDEKKVGGNQNIESTNQPGCKVSPNHDPGRVPREGIHTGSEENNDQVSRRSVLNHLYSLTGAAKVPIIVEMLHIFLADPRNGKICIFAHHLNVLNAIVKGTGLSNEEGSKLKYIRIDGATTPIIRQKQLTQFQSDSSVRVAVLGITAAGVGVTLTAASTIWFAELFWTPAIMIQAEDR